MIVWLWKSHVYPSSAMWSLDFPSIPLNLRGLPGVAGHHTEVEKPLDKEVPEPNLGKGQSWGRERARQMTSIV